MTEQQIGPAFDSPPNAVDIRAVLGNRFGHCGQVSGRDRCAEDGHRGAARGTGTVVAPAGVHLHLHPEARTGLVDDLSELGLDTVDGEQHGKGKLPTQDHLLEVNHLGTDGADPVEEGAGHARTVRSGERDKQGWLVHACQR